METEPKQEEKQGCLPELREALLKKAGDAIGGPILRYLMRDFYAELEEQFPSILTVPYPRKKEESKDE